MKRCFPLVLLIGSLPLLHGCAYDWELEGDLDLDKEILNVMSAETIPSVTACIFKDDQIVWTKAYGKADIENQIEAKTSTIYTLMSVSKLVIATAAVQLVERGVLDLDADINQYLPFPVRNPYFPERMITSRMLLTHTSGLVWPQGEVSDFYFDHSNDSAPPLKEWLRDYFTDNAQYGTRIWRDTPPGQIEQYSNIGSALMAYIVEVASGEDYDEYCKRNIFRPLNMPNTSHFIRDLDASMLAIPYRTNYQRYYHYNHDDYPAGWVRSSVEEFAHFMIAYMNRGIYKGNRILSEKSVDEITTIQNKATGTCLLWQHYAFHWYGHAGGHTGFNTMVEYQKEDRVGLIIFANCASPTTTFYPGGKVHGLIRKEAGKYLNGSKRAVWNRVAAFGF